MHPADRCPSIGGPDIAKPAQESSRRMLAVAILRAELHSCRQLLASRVDQAAARTEAAAGRRDLQGVQATAAACLDSPALQAVLSAFSTDGEDVEVPPGSAAVIIARAERARSLRLQHLLHDARQEGERGGEGAPIKSHSQALPQLQVPTEAASHITCASRGRRQGAGALAPGLRDHGAAVGPAAMKPGRAQDAAAGEAAHASEAGCSNFL